MRGGGGGGWEGGRELVQITGALQSAMGTKAQLWCTCIFRGSIIICRMHKLTLSGQAQLTL